LYTRIIQLSTASIGCHGCHNRLCWCQPDRDCDHQISTSIRVKCWWHCVFFRQCTIMDTDHRGGWT